MKTKKCFFESFASPYSLAETVKTRQNNHMFGTVSEAHGRQNFTLTDSYEEAENILRLGARDIADKMNKSLENIRASTQLEKAILEPYYYGSRVNVPRAIIGHPKAMIRRVNIPLKTSAVKLVYDISANCNIKAEELLKCGIVVLELVYRLEAARIRVELDVCGYAAETNSGDAVTVINLKRGQEPLDVLKVAYPLAHPSFFRRHNFKWMETVSGAEYPDSGYGRHLSKDRLQSILTAHNAGGKLLQYSDIQRAEYNWRQLAKELDIEVK